MWFWPIWGVGWMLTMTLAHAQDRRAGKRGMDSIYLFLLPPMWLLWALVVPEVVTNEVRYRTKKRGGHAPGCQHAKTPVYVVIAPNLVEAGAAEKRWHWACPDCWEQVPAPPPPPPQDVPCRACGMDSKLENGVYFCMGCGVRLTPQAAKGQHNAWTNVYMPRDWPCTQMNDCDCAVCWSAVSGFESPYPSYHSSSTGWKMRRA